MRAWEFLGEDITSPRVPITLRALHKMKLEQKLHEASEIKRRALMRIMYSEPAFEQDKNALERQRLELAQLRAEIAATNAETDSKSAIALHNSAKQGIKSTAKQKQKFNKTIESAHGRKLKPYHSRLV